MVDNGDVLELPSELEDSLMERKSSFRVTLKLSAKSSLNWWLRVDGFEARMRLADGWGGSRRSDVLESFASADASRLNSFKDGRFSSSWSNNGSNGSW